MAEQINTALSTEELEGLNTVLRRVLADEYVLYTKLRNYHWNVVGPMFVTLHELFQAQYTQSEIVIDEVAERIRALGANSIGTMEEFGEFTSLSEHPGKYPDAPTMLHNLVADKETIIRNLRADIDSCADEYNDQGTADMLTGMIKQHEKDAWMLRALALKS